MGGKQSWLIALLWAVFPIRYLFLQNIQLNWFSARQFNLDVHIMGFVFFQAIAWWMKYSAENSMSEYLGGLLIRIPSGVNIHNVYERVEPCLIACR